MSKFNEYLEAVKNKDEKPLKQAVLNSMVSRLKEEIEDVSENEPNRKIKDSDIRQWLIDILGENYEAHGVAASKEQINKAMETLKNYRDKLNRKTK